MTDEEFAELKTNGIKVNYYIVCPRKLWLYAHDFRVDPLSEQFLLGVLVQEHTSCQQLRHGLAMHHFIQADRLDGGGREAK
ncbi:MAG: Dna2/Cas4 domain-containing protein [Anaerolineales bacterium]|nr:Dna2/Cas4 domain-containing protein [Anaerolineales bacterium]